ncbi:MAG: SseB family protein [Methanobrevibacter sp.]|uniref:SseB family protein n=1 Tax=Methanobrevibacter sp. TaxID=66852 RepID=UPI0025E7A94A|nr:SseB family protein [Methanobrevibacter sp.]MBQ8017239.1 SseB family protein [Methanobrevibacter sp.]
MTNHKHLRVVIEDIYANNNELTEELTLRLINEFRYSNLYIPAKRDEFTLNFIIYEDDNGLKLTPLFTDPDEFNKFFKGEEDIELMQNSFELYQNVLMTSDIDGYILNPATEKYVFSKEFILDIKNIPKTNFYSTNTYSIDELKALKDSRNEDLEDFIKNPQNVGNYEALFEKMSQSNLLTLMVSDVDLSLKAKDGVISMMDSGPLAQMFTDNVGGVYATVFSSEDKLKEVSTDKFTYSQVINLSMLVNFVLSEDMDGIVLNPDSDNVLIPRVTLLRYSLGFEKFANDEKLSNSIYYMFLMQ